MDVTQIDDVPTRGSKSSAEGRDVLRVTVQPFRSDRFQEEESGPDATVHLGPSFPIWRTWKLLPRPFSNRVQAVGRKGQLPESAKALRAIHRHVDVRGCSGAHQLSDGCQLI